MGRELKLESDRLIIKSSTFNECRYFNEWEVKDYIKEFLTIEDSRNYEEIVREFISYENDETKLQLTIVCKEKVKPIGRVYISRIDNKLRSLDITRIYIGEEEYLGKGYGKESMKVLIKFCFEDLKMERVTLDTFEGNKKASELYNGLGFVDEGVLRHATKKNDKFYNLKLKSMLKEEYEKTSKI